MNWIQFAVFFIGVGGLFVWNRTESRTDARHMDNKIDAIRELAYSMHKDWIEESKSFHARLVAIEERRK